MAGEDHLRELEEKYEGFKVYDNNGESIGKVDDLFVDDGDREEYIGVKMGLFGLSGTTLIPMELVRVNEGDRVIEVAESKERVKDAPHYKDDDEIDLAFEERIRQHFGLGGTMGGSYDDRPADASGAEGAAAGDNTMRGESLETSEGGSRETVGREQYREGDNYVSDSAMASAAGGAATSGGRRDFDTGEREDRGEYREGEGEGYRQTESQSGAGQEGRQGSQTSGMDDPQYQRAYMEGYREAIRESSGGGSTGGTGSGGGQGDFGERERASEYSGAPSAGPGDGEFDDTQDYGSASTGFQPSRGEGGENEERTRVRRLRRDS